MDSTRSVLTKNFTNDNLQLENVIRQELLAVELNVLHLETASSRLTITRLLERLCT